MNQFNLSDDKVNALLAQVGKKLGKSPEELRSQLEGGRMDSVLGGMDPEKQSRITGLLNNPKALEAMLQNEQIKKMLGGLLGGQK